jgi:hypothetical protein
MTPFWTYSQGTGKLYDPKGKHLHTGYSGRGDGRNNCNLQHVRGVGPTPQGWWRIGKPRDSKRVGPFALDLLPEPGTETFGRSAFIIHGDNSRGDQSASSGCIIMPRKVRNAIWDSGVHLLCVVP